MFEPCMTVDLKQRTQYVVKLEKITYALLVELVSPSVLPTMARKSRYLNWPSNSNSTLVTQMSLLPSYNI